MKPLPWSHIPCVKPPYSMPCLIYIVSKRMTPKIITGTLSRPFDWFKTQ